MDKQLIFVVSSNAVFLLLILYAMIITYRKMIAARKWTSTMGIIFKSAVEKRSYRRRNIDYAIVRYSYQVGGRTYQNAKVSLGPAASGPLAKRLVARYPTGAQVMVFYNPQDPSESVLEIKNSSQWALWLALIVVVSMTYTMIQTMLRLHQP